MKYKGITYDIGTEYISGNTTRAGLTFEVIEKDLFQIKNNLNCNCVRIYGTDKKWLMIATQIALNTGLDVWLSPRLINENAQDTIDYIQNIAREVHIFKSLYPSREIVFILASEATIDVKGFISGETIYERIQSISKPSFFLKKALGITPSYQKPFNKFLSEACLAVKKHFSGRVTYACGMWETVDWKPFDIVSINLYKASFNKSFFERIIKKMKSEGKPLAITEFGCCTYIGADKKGPTGYTVLDTTTEPPTFKEKCERNEKTQADYIEDLLQTFNREKVDATFVFDFYMQKLLYNENPSLDYDKASFGLTKSTGQNRWEPKMSFATVSKLYEEK